MRRPHLQGGALLTACAAGQGAVVVVEGEHREDDEWFYGRWFGHLGPRISFFAQNGWERVVSAVNELRAKLVPRPVFGIIDGDFVAPHAASPSDPGIHRLGRYTLENYLLEPEGWFRVIGLVTRGALPTDWSSIDEVALRVEDAYRECLPLAARNRTVFEEHCRDPRDSIRFREHPDALRRVSIADELAAWGTLRSAPRALPDVYAAHLARLGAADVAAWRTEVTGKAVLKVFLGSLSLAVKRQIPHDVWCSLYLEQQPQPHQDLVVIVQRILDAAGT